jgi:putative hydrolase of the HAD superfamily
MLIKGVGELIQAVAFDYGGVISLPQEEKDMERLAVLSGIEPALMRRVYWDKRSLYDQGLVTGEEFFTNILAGTGVSPDPELLKSLIDWDVQSWSRINPATEKLMEDIKAGGLKIGILSNMVREFLDRNRNILSFFKIPDVMIFSCDVDAVKPEERIYRMLLDGLGCKAEELVFFDDLEPNVSAAQKLGIDGIVWKGPDHAREQLRLRAAGAARDWLVPGRPHNKH